MCTSSIILNKLGLFVCLFVAVDFLLPAQQQLLGLSHHAGKCLHLFLHSYKTKQDPVKGREIWAVCEEQQQASKILFLEKVSLSQEKQSLTSSQRNQHMTTIPPHLLQGWLVHR